MGTCSTAANAARNGSACPLRTWTARSRCHKGKKAAQKLAVHGCCRQHHLLFRAPSGLFFRRCRGTLSRSSRASSGSAILTIGEGPRRRTRAACVPLIRQRLTPLAAYSAQGLTLRDTRRRATRKKVLPSADSQQTRLAVSARVTKSRIFAGQDGRWLWSVRETWFCDQRPRRDLVRYPGDAVMTGCEGSITCSDRAMVRCLTQQARPSAQRPGCTGAGCPEVPSASRGAGIAGAAEMASETLHSAGSGGYRFEPGNCRGADLPVGRRRSRIAERPEGPGGGGGFSAAALA
ncbi:hypothetical protein ATK30_0325 [Amycolatopsis echigonensis]|uniref:Uncharacterized protein n=1 Tax=Amycolatopsis echigonensis TaxID=2576905 RepID=A0A2N3X285_9PSEU|nr:hypothetical protein ATK30_0325 [Amycolatopsis niigatensis]